MFINPQPDENIADETFSDQSPGQIELMGILADKYLDVLLGKQATRSGTLLEIECGEGTFLTRAQARGLSVTGIDNSEKYCTVARSRLKNGKGKILLGDIGILTQLKAKYDYVVCFNLINRVRSPKGLLKCIHDLLRQDGRVLCTVPSIDSWAARRRKTTWKGFSPDHLHYFNLKTLRSFFFQNGFSDFSYHCALTDTNIRAIAGRDDSIANNNRTHMRVLNDLFPKNAFGYRTDLRTADGIGLVAKKTPLPRRRRLSVVMPAYNEGATIKGAIDSVLNKRLEEMEIELIIVESNSTDNTRKVVRQYVKNPRVKVLFEDRPLGKGHAVRTGLKAATGDFVLIQDADNEYDIEDYDVLVEPLANGAEAFILGSRHGGSVWKMRDFAKQPLRALLLNLGHWVFATLVNVLYHVKLKDPFTMYKVFRRDCIDGMPLECNRFDFDFEIVLKLIRRGIMPIEVPVCYHSRSFAEGKKVKIFGDPITWLRALLKYKFGPVQ